MFTILHPELFFLPPNAVVVDPADTLPIPAWVSVSLAVGASLITAIAAFLA
jgi:hypothetical protein